MNRNDFFDKTKVPVSFDKIKKYIIWGVIALIILSAAATCWYTVDEQQRAVITTFGKVTGTADAGMHFKLPFGIQKVELVEVNVYQKIEIGYTSAPSVNGEVDLSVEEESKMITGDYNIVNVDFFVQYKISDPVKYLYGSASPDVILKNLVQSQIRSVVGSTDVDSVLTDGKTEIQIELKDLITEVLGEYDIGLSLVDISIQDSEPPTSSVTAAFKAVETAKQSAEKVINEAEAYQNAQLPAAEAQADSLIQNAEYLKTKRINEAKEAVAMFEAMYSEYALNPEITRYRMYYEMISEVLPGVKVFINTADDGSNIDMILPLDSLIESTVISAGE